MTEHAKPYATWFSAAVWLGIIVNWLLSIPGIFLPNVMLALVRQPLALETPVWPAFASLLLSLLTLFYIPGAMDLYKYRATAIMSVLARMAGVVFFFLIWPNHYPSFGFLDLVMLLIQAPLLYLALRYEPLT